MFEVVNDLYFQNLISTLIIMILLNRFLNKIQHYVLICSIQTSFEITKVCQNWDFLVIL
jgi:hypothetical protein